MLCCRFFLVLIMTIQAYFVHLKRYNRRKVDLWRLYYNLRYAIIVLSFREEPSLVLPKDIAEQQKIADYFKTLDCQITLQTRRLEKLKQIKAACLEKMFV